MKYFVVGLHGSGKREVLTSLSKLGVKCGRLFSDIDEPSDKFYGSIYYELFSTEDVNEVFENNAYIFIQRINQDGKSFYEGISKFEFANNDVFVLSPDQLSSTLLSSIQEPYCFIWMDNNKTNRFTRFLDEKRNYNFQSREEQESRDLGYFVNMMYDSGAPILYFNNEDPIRVSTIIYSTIKYPDLFDLYKTAYNN